MHTSILRDGQLVREWDALNDVVVAKGTIARMSDYTVEIDQQFVAAFRADGVIVATPTGSTAYNLAANGPIVLPTVDAIIVNPIAPHAHHPPHRRPRRVHRQHPRRRRPQPDLPHRRRAGSGRLLLGDYVHCHRSESSVRLIRPRPNGLFNVLRSKLKWGER